MIRASFNPDSLTLTSEDDRKSVSFSYRDYPVVFGHPRFLMADFEKSRELVHGALRQLAGRWMPPKVTISVDREVAGGVTEIDRRILGEIFMHAGARAVVHKNAS
jgi:hypothetical protein